jgi:hypothetical protein
MFIILPIRPVDADVGGLTGYETIPFRFLHPEFPDVVGDLSYLQ